MSEKVSVIIPAYNAETYLEECLNSVLNQTHKDIELVVVNDGSVDGTKNILDEYASIYSNIQVIHTENGGVSRARNIGLSHATGDYIMFLDSDDLLVANAIEILLGDLKGNNADIAAGLMDGEVNSSTVDCEGTKIEVWAETQGLEKSLEDNPFTYSSCAKLFKKQSLEKVHFVEGRKIHEDSYFVFSSLLNQPKVVARNIYLYKYRANENSASHAAFSEKYFDILYFAEEKWKAIEEKYPHLLDKAKNMLVKANIAMLQCLLNTKEKRYKKDIKECIRAVKQYRKYFIPAYPGDNKRFKIVIYNLYGLYKCLYQLKYAKRIKKA